jgi:hypothetical protein
MKKTNLKEYLNAKYGKEEKSIMLKYNSQRQKYIEQGKK